MSLSTMRKNFYRIATLIIDHGADSMRCLLNHFIKKNNKVSIKDFVSNHQHEIYHQFNNAKCCQCSRNYHPPYKTTLGVWQMKRLFDKHEPKLQNHKSTSKCEYCCSSVKSTLQIENIDITLLRFFLVTYFEEEFWQSCFLNGMLFHVFLNTHRHDIFHLLQLNTPCCLCIDNPGYTIMVASEKDRLNRTHWATMFQTSERPCTQHRNNVPIGNTLNPCSVSATIGIRPSDLDGRARMIILSKFCNMMKHIDQLVDARNTVYAHALKGELSNEDFTQLWNVIENSIIYVSNITCTVDSQKQGIFELREKSPEESLCLELQCLILKSMQGNEHVIEACCKLQDTVEIVKGIIDVKLQKVELQISALASNISDVVRNEVSIQLNKYSDTTRNIIDNTRREIEFHDADDTYVKTSAVTAATKILDSKNLLIIMGSEGSGKSCTALEIASLFHSNGYIVMKLEQNLAKDFKTYFKGKSKQLIIFEDLFGKTDIRYNEDLHLSLLEVLTPHVKTGVSKFIITVRSYNKEVDDNIAEYHKLLSDAGVVNLNGNLCLSNLEKEKILTMHATHNGLKISLFDMESILTTNSYLGFPETCHLFCSFEKFFAMGYAFFTSPTKQLQNEINVLKNSGYMNIDPGLQYCFLVYMMLDSAFNDSSVKNVFGEAHESNDSFTILKSIDISVIECLYQSLYDKEIMMTIEELYEICKELSNKYIKKDLYSTTYEFQHQTVLEAVFYSYWHNKTMEYAILNFKVDILAEQVKPFDSTVTVYKTHVIVPMDKCTFLAQKLFKMFLKNESVIFESYYSVFCQCSSLIDQSEFTLNLFKLKLNEWCTIEENIRNCVWIIIKKFIRPLNYKKKSNKICAHADDNFLIHRLVNELEIRALQVYQYIERYCCDKFVTLFNEKLTDRYKSAEDVVTCSWEVIHHFFRPTTFKIRLGQIGTIVVDDWLTLALVNILLGDKHFDQTDDRILEIHDFIETYGCKHFVTDFNRKLTERFQLKENIVNCMWKVIHHFIRPSIFKIDIGKIGAVIQDDWLIQRLIKRCMKQGSNRHVSNRLLEVIGYIEKYGCGQFFKDFNKTLYEWFQSETNVENCELEVIYQLVRPSSFKVEIGQVGTVIKDNWLIQRLIKRLTESRSFKHDNDSLFEVRRYIETYGCELFINYFNKQLMECFQHEENVENCEWEVINKFIRPSKFKIEIGEIGYVVDDDWLIKRLIKRLAEDESFRQRIDSTCQVKGYIEKYGSEQFILYFNKQLREWFQYEENVINCKWEIVHQFIRPSTFKIEIGQIGTIINDDWLIQRLIQRLSEFGSFKPSVNSTYQVKGYIEKYGCEQFILYFNKQLREWFQYEENVINCKWEIVHQFIRPSSCKIEIGQIGTIINDDWLIQRLIQRLSEFGSFKPSINSTCRVKGYIEKYGSENFIKYFNKNLTECFQTEENVANCKWNIMYHFFRPATFKIQNGQVGAVIEDDWLIQRLIKQLTGHESFKRFGLTGDSTWGVKDFTIKYGGEQFVTKFNAKFKELFQCKKHIVNCTWKVVHHFIRPDTFEIKSGQIGTAIDDGWLIQRLIKELTEYGPFESKVDNTSGVKGYVETYGCKQFVNEFNIQLMEWFQSEENIMNCEWEVMHHFIHPTSFQKEINRVGTATIDSILVQRLLKILVEPGRIDDRSWQVKDYLAKYRCEKFVNDFNKSLTEWFQSEENLLNCRWDMIFHFNRPASFKIEIGQTGAATKDDWLIKRLILILNEFVSFKHGVESSLAVKDYVEKYGCENFVNRFNNKLRERFEIPENVSNCKWKVIYHFIRPTSFQIEFDQIGTVTTDEWLIHRLITLLVEHRPRIPRQNITWEIKGYVEMYGCKTFVNEFKEQLTAWLIANVKKCKWPLFSTFVRPKTWFDDKKIEIFINDDHLITYLFLKLEQPTNLFAVKSYIKNYGSFQFITKFNKRLKIKVEGGHTLDLDCKWECLELFFKNVVEFDSEEFTYTNDGDFNFVSDIEAESDFDSNFEDDIDVERLQLNFDHYDDSFNFDPNSNSEYHQFDSNDDSN